MNLPRRPLALFVLMCIPMVGFAEGLDTARIDQALGRSGKQIGDVYKVGFPRTDLHVTINGVALLPGFALGSWAAFSGTDAHATVMGDLVLLPEEVNPVMARLRSSGFEITGLHNHLLFETPRVMYMHYMGVGDAAKLAAALRSALEASATPLGPSPAAAPASAEPEWVVVVEKALGRKGTFAGGVLAFSIPRFNEVTQDAIEIPPAMGVAEAINFESTGEREVAATGDFVLTANEVNPVISALESHHILVTALHNHMLDDEPRLFFMHFWATGSPKAVAQGLKAALASINVQPL
jgi:uncharacterized protein DUF1259